MEALANRFEEEIRDKMRRAKKECRYNPTRFIQMLAQYGAVETAKKLIADALLTGKTSDGFTTLLLCGRLDLTMEDSVCKPEYQSLFSPEEIEYCKKVLGYKTRPLNSKALLVSEKQEKCKKSRASYRDFYEG